MENSVPGSSQNSPGTPAIGTHSRTRNTRGRKRKRLSSESSSDADVLPANAMEVEKSLHASAVKNNLDDVSVKKILKKVVTNDHVLALVKLQEEEEEKASKVENPQPKLTRAKVKELLKVSPKSAPWNLELTPIKHIPVKTRPEVKALISQELHADEDDDEYQPTADDVPSDDDHTLESCSDVDSQPRTPATPRRHASPRVLRDGPFKVPQEISTPRRRLDMDEDATIALRTRSKLSLSSIPIDHIESSFVPPDELPMPVVDDIWSEFLQECMNPETSKNEDDEDDPEYNVAADPDANDEDEEGLENIMKISKKELNDLVTELFNIIPESTAVDVLSGKLASEVPAENNTPTQPIQWEGKQEPGSDEESAKRTNSAERRTERLSLGKCEPLSDTEPQDMEEEPPIETRVTPLLTKAPIVPKPVTLSMVEETTDGLPGADAPAPLRHLLTTNSKVTVHVDQGVKMLPEQIQIMQQQLRQHIQLATSNFLQLYVHPVHWALAPTYRDYLELMDKMVTENPDSVVNVCNLRPAVALIRSWQESVSADTPENAAMVEFVHKEVERARRRAAQNSLYIGNFHETFLKVVSNSPVFLYPYLLPPTPFRSDIAKRFHYLPSEDQLITLGIDEFWQYVENNPELYKIRTIHTKHRWGLVTAVQLLCKHMLTWMPPKAVLCHIQHVRKCKDKDNPIVKFFDTREVAPVKHELLPFNPNLTLYEQPEHEMPRIWIRHLAKSSRRFHNHYFKRTGLNKVGGSTPTGVPVDMGAAVETPKKNPLPINFTQEIVCNRLNLLPPIAPKPTTHDKYDIQITPGVIPTTAPEVPNLYSVVQTPSGAYLVPLSMVTTNSASTPICSLEVKETVASNLPEDSNIPTVQSAPGDHCKCCVLLRSICKERQTLITDFFKTRVKTCPCKEKRTAKYPKVSKKLRLLVNSYKSKGLCAWQGLHYRVKSLTQELRRGEQKSSSAAVQYDLEEIAAVTSFQLKLTMRTAIARNNYMKKKIHTLLSNFKLDEDDLNLLMGKLDKALEAECVDVYKEFLGFLTPEQADKMGKFLDYFIHECVTDLMKRIEDEVSNRRHKLNILMKLRELLEAKLGPCEICAGLLHVVRKYPKLASYVFSLFPHRKDEVDETKAEKPESSKPLEQDAAISILPNNTEHVTSEDIEPKTTNLEQEKTMCNDSEVVDKDKELDETTFDESQPMDYEADNSESDDDGSYENNLTIVEEPDEENSTEIDRNNETLTKNLIDTPHLTVTKTEVGYSESESMSVMSGEDTIKSEPTDWKRDEDKLLLEILKQSLTPEERKDKTIIEVLEEKNVLQLVADSLSHKSIEDVRQRMIYLLKLIVLNNE